MASALEFHVIKIKLGPSLVSALESWRHYFAPTNEERILISIKCKTENLFSVKTGPNQKVFLPSTADNDYFLQLVGVVQIQTRNHWFIVLIRVPGKYGVGSLVGGSLVRAGFNGE